MVVLVLLCGVLGLLVGSFLNVVIYRVPRDESIVTPRSHCPNCDTELANRDNVPVVSWLVLRGKCRTCGNPISVRYPLVELLTGVLFALVAARIGFHAALPAFLVLTAALVALSMIDLDTFLLPKKIVYAAFGAGAGLLLVAGLVDGDTRGMAEAAGGAVIAWVVFRVINFVSPKGMGYGDVRLAGLVGLYLGWIELPLVGLGLFLAFLFASVIGVGLIVTKLRTRKDRVPFGPFLALGAVTAILVGEPILRIYLGR